MHKYIYSLIACVGLLFCAAESMSQTFNPYQHAYQGWDGNKIKKASPIRAFLNKFSVNASLGYGRTFYSFKLSSDVLEVGPKNVLSDPSNPNSDSISIPASLIMLGGYKLGPDSINYSGIVNWLNAPTVVEGAEYLGPESSNQVLHVDSADIKYGGSGFNVPFKISLQYDIDRFRIGGGISYELHGIQSLSPRGQGRYPYVPNFNTTMMFRYFFNLGGKVYHILGWDYYIDLEIGKVKYGKQYDQEALQNGLYFNLGIPMEYELSEYFWVFIRPSYEFKNYTMTITQSDGVNAPTSASFQFNQPALYVQAGVRLKLPEIKRCPVKSCRTQLKHVHGGQEFRGQPFHKEQNPKTGELYPELEQNKWKNRDKMSGKN